MVRQIDTLVVGGGALGSATAWHLARRGADVVLLERDDADTFSENLTRLPHPFTVAYPDTVHLAMVRESLAHWRDLEIDRGVTLVDPRGAALHGAVPGLEALAGRLSQFGLVADVLDPLEAEYRWPGIRFDTRVLVTPQAGRIEPARVIEALRASAVDEGAQLNYGARVTRVRVLGDDQVSVEAQRVRETDGPEGAVEQFLARRVVFTVGAWTGKLLGRLIVLPQMEVRRGQPGIFARAAGCDRPWPSVTHVPDLLSRHYRGWPGSLDAVDVESGVALQWRGIGRAVDPDGGPSRPDPRQRDAMLRYVREWIPGIDRSEFTEVQNTALQTADARMVVDRIGPIVVGAGLSPRDVALAPTIGRILADLADRSDGRAPALFSLKPRLRLASA